MKMFMTKGKAMPAQKHSLAKYAQIGALMLFTLGNVQLANADTNGPKVYTNQDFVESVRQQSKLDLSKPKVVFQHILNSLPETVRVYPTEGYYYFYFYQDGAKYAGNIRLDIEERANGNVVFNYFKATNDWSYDEANNFTRFGKKDDVLVEEVKKLTYKITAGGKSVNFIINDLSDVKPPKDIIRKDEQYLGPILDESGVRFFLLFNPKIKGFHYVLDETAFVADELIPTKVSKNILKGRRSGFAYYKDPVLNRKVLIAVHERNSSVNNYFDGPFDQLPDSFIKGDELKKAIIIVAPGLKGKIDRYGNFDGDSQRYLIAPYTYYTADEDLKFVEDCVTGKQFPDHNRCFLIPDRTPITEPEQEAKKAEENKK